MKIEQIIRDDPRLGGRLDDVKPVVKQLWFRGNLTKHMLLKTVAIVGSRRMSRYGRAVVEDIVPKLCNSGYTIISGLMYGVDQIAHHKTLQCGGVAVAVLGYGIERANDPEADRLADEIVAHEGCVLSEYPGELRGQLWTFPQRNRIVAALSDVVIIVEAGIKSGTMSTARWAKKLNKTVYAVPGSVFARTSEGANYMIDTGLAKALTTQVIDQLTEGKQNLRQNREGVKELNNIEKIIYSQLKIIGPQSINELSRNTHLDVSELLPLLAVLEVRGMLREEKSLWGVVDTTK